MFVLDGYTTCNPSETVQLLASAHYLGPVRNGRIAFAQWSAGIMVAAQVWKLPTSRRLPNDGTWLELSRWCLTTDAGQNAGSRQHAFAVKWIRTNMPTVTTLVSYSDPSQGHTGSLYKACNWEWAPTWHRLRPPPSGNGRWAPGAPQSVKDRWVFHVRNDPRCAELLRVNDEALNRKGW